MARADQDSGTLSIGFRAGDEYATLLDFSIGTTGYSWGAEVYSLVSGDAVVSPTITVVSEANGQVNLSLTETQTADLEPGTYGVRVWWVAPGSVKRTVTDGFCEVRA
jgi:hypothetical protein